MNAIALHAPLAAAAENPYRTLHCWQDGTRVSPIALALLLVVGAIQHGVIAGGTAVMSVFTTAAKAWVVDKLQDVAPNSNSKMEYQGWGTGSNVEAVANTTLHTEASEARALGTLSQPAADTDRVVATQTATAGKTITELGRFNQSVVAGSVMLMRSLFTGLPLLTNDRIEGTQDLQVT